MILLSDSTERFFAKEPPSDSLARELILIPMHVHIWRIHSRARDISSEDLFLCENHLHALCNWTEAGSSAVGWKIGLRHATQRMMIFQNIDSFGGKNWTTNQSVVSRRRQSITLKLTLGRFFNGTTQHHHTQSSHRILSPAYTSRPTRKTFQHRDDEKISKNLDQF